LQKSSSVSNHIGTLLPPNWELKKEMKRMGRSETKLVTALKKKKFTCNNKGRMETRLDNLSQMISSCWESGKMKKILLQSNPNLRQ
jgi:hypothetical protein